MDVCESRVRAKAAKLIALIQDEASSEAEVATASLKLRELLAANGMGMADVDCDVRDARRVVDLDVLGGSRIEVWVTMLASVIAGSWRCFYFIRTERDGWCDSDSYWATPRRRNRHTIRFVGLEEDVRRATEVFLATAAAARNCWSAEAKRLSAEAASYYDQRSFVRSYVSQRRKSYMLGFVSGLADAYRQQEVESKSVALAVRMPSEVGEYRDRLRLKAKTADTSIGSTSAWRAGFANGQGVGSGNRVAC